VTSLPQGSRLAIVTLVTASLTACETKGSTPSGGPEVAPPSTPPASADEGEKSNPVTRWPAPEPFELYEPGPYYAKSPDLLKGTSQVIATIVQEGTLAHNYTKGCAWKAYGVRRQGDEDNGLFWLRWDECGTKKPFRDLSQLNVGTTYRFVLGPPARVKDRTEILDAIVVGGPFPPCTTEPGSLKLEGLAMEQLRTRFGRPEKQGSFFIGERTDGIYRALERSYPAKAFVNESVRIEEWSWRWEDCTLTVWFHAPTGQWHVLDDVYRPIATTGALR